MCRRFNLVCWISGSLACLPYSPSAYAAPSTGNLPFGITGPATAASSPPRHGSGDLQPVISTSASAAPVIGSDTNAFSTMETLDDKHKLVLGDQISFRIVEDQEDPRETLGPKPALIVTDSGDVEVPYIGRFPALGKSCKQLALELKCALEKRYYYQATVILALDLVTRSGGRVYLVGQLRVCGPVEIPGDEVFTLSKAILRAGGFTEFADQRHVKVTRNAPNSDTKPRTFIVNLNEILEKGRADTDLKLEPGDLIFVPGRIITF